MSAPTVTTIRPGVTFTPAAAASFRRLERDLGRQADVNSTYRDWGRQMGMYVAWRAWKAGLGPKPPHSRALHPKDSVHCQGLAWDSDDWRTPGFIALAAAHGWIRTAAGDPTEQHHFEYQWWRDQHRYDPTPSSTPATPEAPPLPALPEGVTMSDVKQMHHVKDGKVAGRALFVPGTAWAVPYTEQGSTYANRFAAELDTGDSIEVTKSLFDAMIAAHARCAPTAITITTVNADE